MEGKLLKVVGVFMKIIEGFHINLIKWGRKKGEEYINYKKRYIWKVPEYINEQIDKGDIVWVNAEDNGRKCEKKVLVVNVLEQKEEQKNWKDVISVAEKYKEKKK